MLDEESLYWDIASYDAPCCCQRLADSLLKFDGDRWEMSVELGLR